MWCSQHHQARNPLDDGGGGGGLTTTRPPTRRNDPTPVPEPVQRANRFIAAFALLRLINEATPDEVAALLADEDHSPLERGKLQMLQTDAGTHAAMILTLCRELRWSLLHSLLKAIAPRLEFGVQAELMPLCAIPKLTAAAARRLYSAGFETPEAVAAADEDKVAAALQSETSFRRTADVAAAAAATAAAGATRGGRRGAVAPVSWAVHQRRGLDAARAVIRAARATVHRAAMAAASVSVGSSAGDVVPAAGAVAVGAEGDDDAVLAGGHATALITAGAATDRSHADDAVWDDMAVEAQAQLGQFVHEALAGMDNGGGRRDGGALAGADADADAEMWGELDPSLLDLVPEDGLGGDDADGDVAMTVVGDGGGDGGGGGAGLG